MSAGGREAGDTDRALFERVRAHLLTQGRRAVRPTASLQPPARCAYRAVDPGTGAVLRCAVGGLIPDEHYQEDLEGMSVACPRVRDALCAAGIHRVGEDSARLLMLEALQAVHDAGDPALWPAALLLLEGEHLDATGAWTGVRGSTDGYAALDALGASLGPGPFPL